MQEVHLVVQMLWLSKSALVALGLTLSLESSCSKRCLTHLFAADLSTRYERGCYDEDWNLEVLESPEIRRDGLSTLRGKLGKSICAYAVEVTGISLTSEAVREVVFAETKIYDVAKLTTPTSFVDALIARRSPLPVEAVSDTTMCPDKNSRCSQYHFVVIDPANGKELVLDRMRRSGVRYMS